MEERGNRRHRNPLRVVCVPAVQGNPYLRLLASHLAEYGVDVGFGNLSWNLARSGRTVAQADVIHVHWLVNLLGDPRRVHLAVKLGCFLLSIIWLRLRGKGIVWTVHNLYAHERTHIVFDRRLRRWLGRFAHVVLTHSESARRQVAEDYGRGWAEKISVVPHGHFIDVYPNDISQEDARKRLGIEQDVPLFLFLGQLREYKGIPDLIEAFDRLDGGARLIIAGKPITAEIGALLRDRVGGRNDVWLRLGFIPDEDIQLFMNACDALVFPYRNVLTSGGAVLAMSFARACVAPRMGCIAELLDERGAFLYDPLDERGLGTAMKRAVEARETLADMGLYNRNEIARFTWQEIASRTAELYRQCF